VLDRLDEFRLLDAYQLVKHYLGLRLTYPARPLTLVYLFWEPMNPATSPVFAQHRTEVSLFEEMAADDPTCIFKWECYPDHWNALGATSSQPDWLKAHLERLRLRYRVPV
jgi:hypothetical protein